MKNYSGKIIINMLSHYNTRVSVSRIGQMCSSLSNVINPEIVYTFLILMNHKLEKIKEGKLSLLEYKSIMQQYKRHKEHVTH